MKRRFSLLLSSRYPLNDRGRFPNMGKLISTLINVQPEISGLYTLSPCWSKIFCLLFFLFLLVQMCDARYWHVCSCRNYKKNAVHNSLAGSLRKNLRPIFSHFSFLLSVFVNMSSFFFFDRKAQVARLYSPPLLALKPSASCSHIGISKAPPHILSVPCLYENPLQYRENCYFSMASIDFVMFFRTSRGLPDTQYRLCEFVGLAVYAWSAKGGSLIRSPFIVHIFQVFSV